VIIKRKFDFCYISEEVEKIDVGHKTIYITHLDYVLSTSSANSELTAEIEPCNHDARIHVAHHVLQGTLTPKLFSK